MTVKSARCTERGAKAACAGVESRREWVCWRADGPRGVELGFDQRVQEVQPLGREAGGACHLPCVGGDGLFVVAQPATVQVDQVVAAHLVPRAMRMCA